MAWPRQSPESARACAARIAPSRRRVRAYMSRGLATTSGSAWPIAVAPVSDGLLGEVVALDTQAAGTDRRRLFEQLHREMRIVYGP